jgi:RND family efflux transporter MFP subunit
VLLSATVLIAVLLNGCGRREHPEAKSAAGKSVGSVATLTVHSTETAKVVEATGTVAASLTADLAPKIMSKVAAVLVNEGDHVTKGQVLVRLEAADLAAQVRQGQAAVESAQAAVAQAQTGQGIQKTQSTTRVAQAKAALRQAQEQLSLVKEGARKQQKQQADEGVRLAEAGKAQAEEGVHQVEAALAAAKARLSLVKEGARKQQKLQAEAAVRQAEANQKTAQATHDRFKPLAEQGVISQQRMDEIALQLEVAKSQLETAKQQASLVNEGARTQEVQQAEEGVRQAEAAVRMAQQKSREADSGIGTATAQRELTYEGARGQEVTQTEQQVKQAEEALRMAEAATDENKIKADTVKMLRAQVRQAEASLTGARVQLGYATILAPFAGAVTKRHADPGAMTAPGVPLVTLVDNSGFRLEAVVPESQMLGLALGAEAEVVIDALSRTLTGWITQIVPGADQASRTSVVKFGLPKVEGLVPGLFGRVSIPVGRTTGLFVPREALWHEGSLVGVLVIEAGVAHKRMVTVGKEATDQVEILSGLSEGEVIVARDVDRVPDGATVGSGGEAR